MDEESKLAAADSTKENQYVAVVIPLFGRQAGLERSLVSLARQTRRPDIVVLLGDGKKSGIEALRGNLEELPSEVLETGMPTLSGAINIALQFLANYHFVTFLRAGDEYAPERIERCLATIQTPKESKLPNMVITGIEAIDGRGESLLAEDARVKHLARIWAKADSGVSYSEWLGMGDAVATISNVFVRRTAMVEEPLPEDLVEYFPYFSAVSAAVQGDLRVLTQPLVRHYPGANDLQINLQTTTEFLHAQLHLLKSLSEKLEISPETRFNFTSFHRASWNNLSGQREDLFQQIMFRWASLARPEDLKQIARGILRTKAAETAPAHILDMMEDEAPLDNAAYAAALSRTRARLHVVEHENEHLLAIADVARESGWVRFGAWLGERSSRQIFEIDENGVAGEEA